MVTSFHWPNNTEQIICWRQYFAAIPASISVLAFLISCGCKQCWRLSCCLWTMCWGLLPCNYPYTPHFPPALAAHLHSTDNKLEKCAVDTLTNVENTQNFIPSLLSYLLRTVRIPGISHFLRAWKTYINLSPLNVFRKVVVAYIKKTI